jgi:IS1 family transposase
MEFTGHIERVSKDFKTERYLITLMADQREIDNELPDFKAEDKLSIKIKKFSPKRSLDANALLWKCLSEMAMHEGRDKWDLYIEKLKKHGKAYANSIDARGLNDLKAMWREVEVIDRRVDITGREWVDVLLYPGSHLYTTKEFSKLLDDVIEDMKADGLQPPTSKEMQRSLELWEKSNTAH